MGIEIGYSDSLLHKIGKPLYKIIIKIKALPFSES